MMTSMLWTLIALMGVGLVALLVDSRTGRRDLRSELRTEIGGLRMEMRHDMGELRDRVQVLAERQAEMNGRLDVVAAMAHTHPPVATE